MHISRILIVSQRNACRSIIAEALFKKLGRGLVEVESAGSNPAERINPQTLGVLRRHGLGIIGLRSKSWNEFSTARFDLVITVADRAIREPYPLFPGQPKKIQWPLESPLQFGCDDAETEGAIVQTYQSLKKNIDHFCREQRVFSVMQEQAAG